MISKHRYLLLLVLILFLNIIFAKKIVHQFFYQNYVSTLIFVGLNVILFPIALFIYRRDRKRERD